MKLMIIGRLRDKESNCRVDIVYIVVGSQHGTYVMIRMIVWQSKPLLRKKSLYNNLVQCS